MKPHTDCEAVRPLLHAALEGSVSRDERITVNAHLAVCEDCRSFERAERALTELLETPAASKPLRSRLATWAGIAAVLTLTLLLFPAATPEGSIVERQLTADSSVTESTSELSRSNHLAVGRDGAVEISLPHGLKLQSIGPARFELDFVEGVWKLVVLDGRILVTSPKAGLMVAVNRSGRIALSAGVHQLTVDSIRQNAPDAEPPADADVAANDPAKLVEEGMSLYFSRTAYPFLIQGRQPGNQMQEAEMRFRAALASTGVSDATRNDALFYLAATLGQQGKHMESLEVGARWLKMFPDDSRSDLARFYQGARHEKVGQYEQADQIWWQLVKEKSSVAHHAKAYLDTVQNRRK